MNLGAMAFTLRPYQSDLKARIYHEWNQGHRNVLAVMPTGGGKTKTFCDIAREMAVDPAGPRLPTTIMVHRKELVSQISLTLAEEGITHNIIAPRSVILGITAAQRQLLGRQFYDYKSVISVVSVDTLNSRIEHHFKWAAGIRLWITDEATHLLKENKWGQAVMNFPDAIGLGVTATPERLDKKGLGSHADGVFDAMVKGPTTRWLIDNKFLSKYKIVIPNSDYESYLKDATSGADFSKGNMVSASERSRIVGDVVLNYKKFADGKQAILFATDIDTGHKMEKAFREAKVKAKLLTGTTPDSERLQSMVDFRDRKIAVLLNVDLFDEGLDVPGIEAVIMARPTASVAKYLQMCGRGLRILEGKPHMILIDHVGNVKRHGYPDTPRKWTLDRIKKRGIRHNFMRICENTDCNSPFDRALTECPYCGWEIVRPKPGAGAGRIPPEMVDGDMMLIDPETLREMYDKTILESPDNTARRVTEAAGIPAGKAAFKNQKERIETQKDLALTIAQWAGVQRDYGYTDRQIQKRFFVDYDMTITEALGQKRAEMLDTIRQIKGALQDE